MKLPIQGLGIHPWKESWPKKNCLTRGKHCGSKYDCSRRFHHQQYVFQNTILESSCKVRIYKILFEAFLRIIQNEFEVENLEVTNAVHQRLANNDDLFDLEQILVSPELHQYTTQFIIFKDSLWEFSDLAKFCKTFWDMI